MKIKVNHSVSYNFGFGFINTQETKDFGQKYFSIENRTAFQNPKLLFTLALKFVRV